MRKQLVLFLFALWALVPALARAENVIQQLDQSHSKMHFELSGSILQLSGKFNRFNGSINLNGPTLTPEKVIIKIDVSEVNVAPVENLPYIAPETIFRAIPNPVVTFTSTNITEVSKNNFKIDGLTRRGEKEWKTTFQAVRRKGTGAESEYLLNMRGPISSFVSELPLALQGMQQEGVLECTLNFRKS